MNKERKSVWKTGLAAAAGLLLLLLVLFLGIRIGRAMEASAPGSEPTVTLTPPTKAAEPTKASEPTKTAVSEPTVTPEPEEAAEPTKAPEPTKTAVSEPTITLEPTKAAEPTKAPEPTKTAVSEPTVTPEPTKAVEPEKEGIGALRVEGTKLVDETGKAVQLRGVSTHGLSWFPEYVNGAMIAQLKDWGCNVVRLALYTAEYNGYCSGGNKEALKRRIDEGVRAAVEQEMYVIIDWHILSDGNPVTHKDEAKKFFAEMAERYAGLPNVIYEICNEPNGGVSWNQIKGYAQEVIPVIRAYAPEAVIVVGTPTWSQDVDAAAQDPLTDCGNVLYALHFYAATHKESLRQKAAAAIQKGLPLFVTEFGICDASGGGAIDEAEAGRWISFLDEQEISYVMWNLSNNTETCAMIKSSCSKHSGLTEEELSDTGRWFVSMMKNSGQGSSGEQGAGETDSGQSSGTSAEKAGETSDYASVCRQLFAAAEGISASCVNGWNTENGSIGLQIDITVRNVSSAVEADWSRTVVFPSEASVLLTQCWNAAAEVKDGVLILTPAEYNRSVPAEGELGGIGLILEVTLP